MVVRLTALKTNIFLNRKTNRHLNNWFEITSDRQYWFGCWKWTATKFLCLDLLCVCCKIFTINLINISSFKNLVHWYAQVYSGLQSRVGLINHIADGFSWIFLRCIHDDQKVHSAQRFALKAECNSRLAVALTIVEE